MSYVLYYATGTASLAVHWMLIELGVEFRAEHLDLGKGEQHSPSYLQLNPAGRVPTLLVDGQPYTESAALLMLLAAHHPEANLAPENGNSRRDKWLEAMIYLTNNLSPAMRDWFYAEADGELSDVPAIKRLALVRIEGVWDRLNILLSDGRPYLLGEDMTTADFLAIMLMKWSRNMPRPATGWQYIAPYVIRMRARPSFREVCRREGLVDWLNN